uniref:Myb/SANT-like DNA-binding domain-containing protein n=1 Tax=Pelusios castaneus TaxID=367368 RepID=A0A8C8SJV0_9SAUR
MAAQRGKRAPAWTTAEVLDRRGIWGESAVQAQLRGSRQIFDIFAQISRAMAEKGYERDTLQCRSKVKELRITYHRAREANQRSGSAPVTCRFYKEVEAILSRDPITTPNAPVDTLAPRPMKRIPEQTVTSNTWTRKWRMTWSATACSQELFCTSAEMSTQDMNCSVSSEAAEEGSGKFLFHAAMAPAKISLSGLGCLLSRSPLCTLFTLRYIGYLGSVLTTALLLLFFLDSTSTRPVSTPADRMRNIRWHARRNREDMFQDLLKTAQESARENQAWREESQQRRQKHRDEHISVMKEQTELLKSMIALQTQAINVRAPLHTVQPCLPPTPRSPSKNFFEGHQSPWYTATSSPPQSYILDTRSYTPL